MRLKPAQGELNAALLPIFADIRNTHLIHDDLIIATQTMNEHLTTLKDVMNAMSISCLKQDALLAKRKLICMV